MERRNLLTLIGTVVLAAGASVYEIRDSPRTKLYEPYSNESLEPKDIADQRKTILQRIKDYTESKVISNNLSF